MARITTEAELEREPCVILTGGDGGLLMEMFPEARYFPSLAMHGLALCAWHQNGGPASHD